MGNEEKDERKKEEEEEKKRKDDEDKIFLKIIEYLDKYRKYEIRNRKSKYIVRKM